LLNFTPDRYNHARGSLGNQARALSSQDGEDNVPG
jgi:hypothetical protein